MSKGWMVAARRFRCWLFGGHVYEPLWHQNDAIDWKCVRCDHIERRRIIRHRGRWRHGN